jgi:hypothetical protein
MARKAKRRVFRRPRPQQRTEDAAQKLQRLEAAASSLLSVMDDRQLGDELSAREWDLAEADRIAQLDPNPINLSRYRQALSQYDAARHAVKMVNGRTAGAGGAGGERS